MSNPVPSNQLVDLQRNIQDIDRVVNQTSGTVTNRTGTQITPIPAIVAGVQASADAATAQLPPIVAGVQASANAANAQIQQAIDGLINSGFFPVDGSFTLGGTITERNQVLFNDADSSFYSWSGALPKVVSASSTPASSGGIGLNAWVNRADAALRSALAAPDSDVLVGGIPAGELKSFTDYSFTGANISARTTTKTFSTEQIKAMAEMVGHVNINGGASSLQFVRLTVPVVSGADLEFYINAELSTALSLTTSSANFYLVGAACDNVSRLNPSTKTLSGLIATDIGYKITIPPADLTSTHFSLDIRLAATSLGFGIIKGITAKQSGKIAGKSLYNLIRPSSEWTANLRNTAFAEPDGAFLSGQDIDRTKSELVSSNVLSISPKGAYSYLAEFSSLKFYNDLVRLESNPVLVRCLAMQLGDYYPYREEFPVNITKDLALVAVGGRVNIRCSDVVAPTLQSSSGGINYYTAPVSVDRNYNASVRSGAVQPSLGFELVNSTESIFKYQLTATTSTAAVQANAKTYFFSGGVLHFSYPTGFSLPMIHVCHSRNGVNMFNPTGATTAASLFGFNIHIFGAVFNNWAMAPTNYAPYPTTGSKFISLQDCSGIAAAINEGCRIDNIDHELINCNFSCNGNDGFNLHFNGRSYIEGGRAWNNGQDGVSHHEQQKGYVIGNSMRYNGAGNSTPAFGADVYHKNCESIAASDGLTTKIYSGTFCALGGNAGDAIAWYDDCYSDLSISSAVAHYRAVTLNAGSKSEVYVIAPRFDSDSNIAVATNGPGNNIIERR